MCYDAKYLTKRVEKYADRYGIPTEDIDPVIMNVGRVHHTSGFAHQKIPVITGEDTKHFQFFSWGLVPSWAKSWNDVLKIRNKTLNARSETVFDLPSFKVSVRRNRCLVVFDAFYEHHHLGKSTYPFHIELKNEEPMSLAGVYSVWKGENEKGEFIELPSVSVLTTKANDLMAQIHNNPKLKEPRMPVIIPNELENEWIKPRDENEVDLIKDLLKPYPSELLKVRTVRPLRGKNALGNISKTEEEFQYPVIGLPPY
ncbi:MAG: SOS response-associated peptidase [Bacteroidia bacterium]